VILYDLINLIVQKKTFKFQLDNLSFGRTMSLRHFDLRIRMYMFDINQQLYKHRYTITILMPCYYLHFVATIL
jgi:hypothetical protein